MNRPNWYKQVWEYISRSECKSAFLLFLFMVVALYSIFVSPQLYKWNIHEGDIALENAYAPYDFTYLWEINEEETSKARLEALKGMPYTFRRRLDSEKHLITELQQFFDLLEVERDQETSLSEKIGDLRNTIGEELSNRDLRAILEYPDVTDLRDKTLDITKGVLLMGYAGKEDHAYLEEKGAQKVLIYDEEIGAGIERGAENILNSEDSVRLRVDDYAAQQFGDARKIRQAVANLVMADINPNIEKDEEKIEKDRKDVIRKVKPTYHIWTVEKNELIIERGKRVNAQHIAQILKLRRIFRPGTTPALLFGEILLLLLLSLIGAIYTSVVFKVNFLKDTKNVAITLLNMVFIIIMADFIVRSPQPSYFIPMAGMGMMIALTVGFNVAFLAVILMSIFIALFMGGGVEVILVLLVGSTVGMYTVKDARRRAKILWAGLLVGIAKFVAIVCVSLINGIEPDVYIRNGVWGIASGLFSGFVVMGLLPVFEHLFKVPTNISLLEMSDLNHPLLKKLALEAPGTYHHCIMVGNLAEAACDSIDANSLRARVGAYYHDIGKIAKAEYFNENEMGSGSRHSNLTSSMSALIISKHVKDGLEMAKRYKLNMAITDFISQHHGDSLIAYFYQKALEKAEGGIVPKEEDFRYPGPKPQTKESAIVLLADAVEASSRTLSDPTPSSIRNLVKKMINNKFIDGQLDECDLTLKDMNKIADSFVRVLMGVFHTRLTYPENTKKQSNGALPNNGSKDKYRKQKQKKKD